MSSLSGGDGIKESKNCYLYAPGTELSNGHGESEENTRQQRNKRGTKVSTSHAVQEKKVYTVVGGVESLEWTGGPQKAR